MRFKILYSCVSHIGNVRDCNQDNFICDGHYREIDDGNIVTPLSGKKLPEECPVFGIFDGMGGEEHGEIASHIAAADALILKPDNKGAADSLLRFCQTANADICEYAKRNGISSMGTTAAMLVFSKNEITLCNIGDSKIFRLSDGKFEQISIDHIAPAPFGMKPPLFQNLGIPPDELTISPYIARGLYNDGDIYVICSDGLTDMVGTDEIAHTLTSAPFETASTSLLEKALEGGGRDNITIILCKIERYSGSLFDRKRRNKKKEVSK